MKRDDFIGNKFNGAMDKLMECISEMQELGIMTGDRDFITFAELLNLVVTTAQKKDMEELFMFVIPFLEKKAAEEVEAEGSSELPKEIMDRLRGLDGSDPSKLN